MHAAHDDGLLSFTWTSHSTTLRLAVTIVSQTKRWPIREGHSKVYDISEGAVKVSGSQFSKRLKL